MADSRARSVRRIPPGGGPVCLLALTGSEAIPSVCDQGCGGHISFSVCVLVSPTLGKMSLQPSFCVHAVTVLPCPPSMTPLLHDLDLSRLSVPFNACPSLLYLFPHFSHADPMCLLQCLSLLLLLSMLPLVLRNLFLVSASF